MKRLIYRYQIENRLVENAKGCRMWQPFCCGGEKNAHIYAVHLMTANQCKMCGVYLAMRDVF